MRRSTGHSALKVTSNLFPGANCSLLTLKTRTSHAGACSVPGLQAPGRELAAGREITCSWSCPFAVHGQCLELFDVNL